MRQPTVFLAGIGMCASLAGSVSLLADGPQGPRAVRCWGSDDYGQCTVPADLGTAVALAGGWQHTIALRTDGSIRCWGRNDLTNGGPCNVPADLGTALAVAGGGAHTIALRTDGSVRCWGRNSEGQCNVPADLGTAVSVAGGDLHTIALRTDGSVRCWGSNGSGQCNVPADLGTAVAVAGGGAHTIALRTDGSVRCWGSNGSGQCNVPADLGTTLSIAGGGAHTIALRADGSVRCWGENGWDQCNVPANLGTALSIAGGGAHTIALWNHATLNLRSGNTGSTIAAGILSAADGDTLLCSPWAMTDTNIDYRGKSIELLSTNAIARNPSTTTLFADGARLSAPETIALDGTINVPTNAGISLSSGLGLSIAGNTFVSLGGSMLAQNDGTPVALAGDMVLATDAVFNALAPVNLTGTLDILGGVIVSDDLVTLPGSELVVVNGTVDVGLLTIGGNASSLSSAIVSDVEITADAELAASGQLVGDVLNEGRVIGTDDLVIVGNVVNEASGTMLAQVGILYITGSLVNEGAVFGNVVTAPGFKGGGGGGSTQPGDGIRIAGDVRVGPSGELRFVEDLWKFSLCGDLSLACPSGAVRFNGAELAFDGCGGTEQRLEATSADLGCDADLFEGEDAGVSLFGEIAVTAGSTVRIVDEFANAPGKGGEAVYARGLSVAPGATLITGGLRVYTMNANIEGTVDDPSNVCEVPDLPNPDINDDGKVNAIDLAYVLTYWGTATAIADLNRDGVVDAIDLGIVLSGWAP